MSDLIFGKTWGQIQEMQQGTCQKSVVSGEINKPVATKGDIKLLKEHGLDGLKEMRFDGVIDRLNTSGLLYGLL